jgi:hypothetical protein
MFYQRNNQKHQFVFLSNWFLPKVKVVPTYAFFTSQPSLWGMYIIEIVLQMLKESQAWAWWCRGLI